jgi:hypothetical protein
MGGSKTAILAQVVHFYLGGVGHITIGGNKLRIQGMDLDDAAGCIAAE